jgi:hypothetical protein
MIGNVNCILPNHFLKLVGESLFSMGGVPYVPPAVISTISFNFAIDNTYFKLL